MGRVHKNVSPRRSGRRPDLPDGPTTANFDKGLKIMSVSLFHRAADSVGTLFILLMGLATGGAMAVVGF